jgi:hypothetical protein
MSLRCWYLGGLLYGSGLQRITCHPGGGKKYLQRHVSTDHVCLAIAHCRFGDAPASLTSSFAYNANCSTTTLWSMQPRTVCSKWCWCSFMLWYLAWILSIQYQRFQYAVCGRCLMKDSFFQAFNGHILLHYIPAPLFIVSPGRNILPDLEIHKECQRCRNFGLLSSPLLQTTHSIIFFSALLNMRKRYTT